MSADQPLAASGCLFRRSRCPAGFADLIGGQPGVVRVAVAHAGDGAGAIVLQTDPINEIGEVWGESRDAVLVLAGFALLSALLICAVVGRALRPIETLSSAFPLIGQGDYHGTVPEHGPPELLATGASGSMR